MLCQSCPRCGAKFLGGQLYWSTGKPGSPLDLAGLVCNRANDKACINPERGREGGDTWEKRSARIDAFTAAQAADQRRLQGP